MGVKGRRAKRNREGSEVLRAGFNFGRGQRQADDASLGVTMVGDDLSVSEDGDLG